MMKFRTKSSTRHTKKNQQSGSITVEASLVVPIFFLVFFSLCYLFSFITLKQEMARKLFQVSKEYSASGIQTKMISSSQGKLSTVKWNIKNENGFIYSSTSISIPFISDRIYRANLYQQMQVNRYRGKSMIPKQSQEDGSVYVAETGRVYHKIITCTYLKLGIKTVQAEQVPDQRNQSGGKYKPCEACAENLKVSSKQILYITTYGNRYHETLDCSKLRRSVRKIKKSQVGNMPPCSKCAKE